jgi:hypothetical protein
MIGAEHDLARGDLRHQMSKRFPGTIRTNERAYRPVDGTAVIRSHAATSVGIVPALPQRTLSTHGEVD